MRPAAAIVKHDAAQAGGVSRYEIEFLVGVAVTGRRCRDAKSQSGFRRLERVK